MKNLFDLSLAEARRSKVKKKKKRGVDYLNYLCVFLFRFAEKMPLRDVFYVMFFANQHTQP
jgi:hypothetical protein